MKKFLLYTMLIATVSQGAYALNDVFDSMDKAQEVKLAPAIKTTSSTTTSAAVPVSNSVSTYSTSLKEQKFNSALVNLDDAQVELRQELSTVTAKYTEALNEKAKAIAHCKELKKEIKAINKKMKNVDKSKKMINKNLEVKK